MSAAPSAETTGNVGSPTNRDPFSGKGGDPYMVQRKGTKERESPTREGPPGSNGSREGVIPKRKRRVTRRAKKKRSGRACGQPTFSSAAADPENVPPRQGSVPDWQGTWEALRDGSLSPTPGNRPLDASASGWAPRAAEVWKPDDATGLCTSGTGSGSISRVDMDEAP